jgi:predicted  nucleic acid-binding Zn-ribbon protein
MPRPELSDELRALRKQVENLRDQLGTVEVETRNARKEARQAREEVLRLRDQVVAAERDQQELKTARARLARISVRGLLTRILNRR